MKRVFFKTSLLFLVGLFAVALTGELYASKAPRKTRKEKIKARDEKQGKKVESATAAAPLVVTKAIDVHRKTMFPNFSYEELEELHRACLRFYEVAQRFVAEKNKDNSALSAVLKNILDDAIFKMHACLAKKEISLKDFVAMVPALLVQVGVGSKDSRQERQKIRDINEYILLCLKVIEVDNIVLKDHATVSSNQDLFDTIFLGQPHLIRDPNNKARINELDKHGYSLLMYAICANNADMVKLLVGQGADIKKLHEGKRSVYSLATDNAVKKILEDAGAKEFEQALLEKRRSEVKVRLEASRQDVKKAQETKHEKFYLWGAFIAASLEILETFENNTCSKNLIAYSQDLLQVFLGEHLSALKRKNIEELQELDKKATSLKTIAKPIIVDVASKLFEQAISKVGKERRKCMVGAESCSVVVPADFIMRFLECEQGSLRTIDESLLGLSVTAFLSRRQKNSDKDALMQEVGAALDAVYKEYSAKQPRLAESLSSQQPTKDTHGNSLVDYGLLIGNDMALRTVIHPNTINTPNKHGFTPLAFVLQTHDADRLKAFLQRASEIMPKHEVMNLINKTRIEGKHPFEYIGALSERGIDDGIVQEMHCVLCNYCVRQEGFVFDMARSMSKVEIATAREAQVHFGQMKTFLMHAALSEKPMNKKIDGGSDREENENLKKVKETIKREEQQKAKALSKARNKEAAEQNAQKKKEQLQKELEAKALADRQEQQRFERERDIALKLKEAEDKKLHDAMLKRQETQAKKQARKQAARELQAREQLASEREIYRKREFENFKKTFKQERTALELKQEQEITRDALLCKWQRFAKLLVMKDGVVAAHNDARREKEHEEQELFNLTRSISLPKEQKARLEFLRRNQELRQRRKNQRSSEAVKKTVLRASAPAFQPKSMKK